MGPRRRQWARPCLVYLAVLFILSASSAQAQTEVLGFSKPPDDDVTKDAHLPAIRGDASTVRPHDQAAHLRPTVPVTTVAFLTFLMAVATGLGSIPFFFYKLDDSWKGACNGVACGVMLAASFDLISEGQAHGGGTCVMIGILLGGLFIIASQKILESFGDVKLVDLSGASARRMITIVAVMTLHSFGEGAGVGVSFAGPKGFAQGLLVTIAIAVHNVPEGMAVSMVLASQGVQPFRAMLWSIFTSLPQALVAVPAFAFAGLFSQFLPLCTGFAAGCMIWIVFGEVMPEALEEGAKGSHIATAATVAVAVMEWLSTSLQGLENPPQWDNVAPFLLSLLFILGPLLGGLVLLGVKQALPLHAALLSGLSAGAMCALALWQPLQFMAAGKQPVLYLAFSFLTGSGLYVMLCKHLQIDKKYAREEGLLGGKNLLSGKAQGLQGLLKALVAPGRLGLSPGACLTATVTLALCLHSLAEGLMLGVAAAPKSAGLGMPMLLPVALHGLPRGVAAAAALLGLGSSPACALLAATLSGLAGPLGAVFSLAAGLDYQGLDLWLTLACGFLLPAAFLGLLPRAMGFDKRRAIAGVLVGVAVVVLGFSSTRFVCMRTTYCNSAPEALT